MTVKLPHLGMPLPSIRIDFVDVVGIEANIIMSQELATAMTKYLLALRNAPKVSNRRLSE